MLDNTGTGYLDRFSPRLPAKLTFIKDEDGKVNTLRTTSTLRNVVILSPQTSHIFVGLRRFHRAIAFLQQCSFDSKQELPDGAAHRSRNLQSQNPDLNRRGITQLVA